MENKYPINIMWSEEDGEYLATCSAFPRLSAFGETEEEALKEGKVARKLFIDACIRQGIPLPEPQFVQAYSGQVRLRLPKMLHQQAAIRADLEGVSLNTFFVDAIAMRVGAEDLLEKFTNKLASLSHPLLQNNFVFALDSDATKFTELDKYQGVFRLGRTSTKELGSIS